MSVYLDHASTTPMRPEALAAMLPYLTDRFANPSGSHHLARAARAALEDAREQMAGVLGCHPGEIVFTAGGTESANMAVRGVHAVDGADAVCSAVEHHAVLHACRAVGGREIEVGPDGVIDLGALADHLHPGVGVVSVMLVNNEVGTIQPLARVVDEVRRHAPRAVVHTDAVAAVGWLDVAAATAAADLVSISAHKFGGPKGVGALVVRRGVRIAPVSFGGPQERGRRPGTHDLAGVVGMTAALMATERDRPQQVARVGALRDRLADGVLASVPGAWETGAHRRTTANGSGGAPDRGGKVVSSCHVGFDGVDQEELLVLLDDAGVCASAGAACASGALEPSHVVTAMGLTTARARSVVRLSLGVSTTAKDVDTALRVIPKAVEQLRA